MLEFLGAIKDILWRFLVKPSQLVDSLQHQGARLIDSMPLNDMLTGALLLLFVFLIIALGIAAYAGPIYLSYKSILIARGEYGGKHSILIVVGLIAILFFYASFVQQDIKEEAEYREYKAQLTQVQNDWKQGLSDGYTAGLASGWADSENYTEAQNDDAYLTGYREGQLAYPDKLASNANSVIESYEIKPSADPIEREYSYDDEPYDYSEEEMSSILLDPYKDGYNKGYERGHEQGEEDCHEHGYYYSISNLYSSYTEGYIDGQSDYPYNNYN